MWYKLELAELSVGRNSVFRLNMLIFFLHRNSIINTNVKIILSMYYL